MPIKCVCGSKETQRIHEHIVTINQSQKLTPEEGPGIEKHVQI